MPTKRFTDAEKWKDPFFENLSNDYKIIWLYLLDDCDNAGIIGKSIKRINFNCNTNITEEDLLNTFKNRLFAISDDIWFIPKFLEFQYGTEWITSTNKAVVSVRKKLLMKGIDPKSIPYQYPINTLLQKEQYPIDTAKDKDKEKEKDKVKDNVQDKSKDLSKEQDKEKWENKIIDELKAV